LFERPRSGERALLVRIGLGGPPGQDELSEFDALARSAGAEVLRLVTGTRRAPDPRLYIGSGKAEEIRGLVAATGADLVLFDHALSPSQERNLEALFKMRTSKAPSKRPARSAHCFFPTVKSSAPGRIFAPSAK
jgi:GTP-binding protein HflX